MKLHLELLRGKCKRIYMTNIKPSILTAKWTEGFNFFLASDNRELKPLTGYIIKLSNAWTLHTNLFRKLQPWEQLNYSRLISVISILVFIGPIDAYFPILLRIDVELSSGYLAVIGDLQHEPGIILKTPGHGKKTEGHRTVAPWLVDNLYHKPGSAWSVAYKWERAARCSTQLCRESCVATGLSRCISARHRECKPS